MSMQKQKFLTNFEKSQWDQKYFVIAFEFSISITGKIFFGFKAGYLEECRISDILFLNFLTPALHCCGKHMTLTLQVCWSTEDLKILGEYARNMVFFKMPYFCYLSLWVAFYSFLFTNRYLSMNYLWLEIKIRLLMTKVLMCALTLLFNRYMRQPLYYFIGTKKFLNIFCCFTVLWNSSWKISKIATAKITKKWISEFWKNVNFEKMWILKSCEFCLIF